MSKSIRLRFAPSPTGPLHLGGLRTALFNHLFARKFGGEWILRIEDTDATRFVPGSIENIRKGLEWAGLQYDYGPGLGGPHGPYFQSQRLDLYHVYAKQLLERGDAYRCFCSETELQSKRLHLQASGSTATYDRTCHKLTEEEVTRRMKVKEKFVVRLDDSANRNPLPLFTDLIFGEVKDAQGSLPTDPILIKSDHFPTYHMANVVDDHEMGISHVVRGEEWLPSLSLHRSLYNRLGWTPPKFAHLPLLLNPDGSKMSKRKGDSGVDKFMSTGWEPSAVVNWLAIAGKNINISGTDSESRNASTYSEGALVLEELTEGFDLSNYTKRRAVLDPNRLSQLNKAHIARQLSSSDAQDRARLAERASTVLKEANIGISSSQASEEFMLKVITVLGDRLERINQLPTIGKTFFDIGETSKGGVKIPCEKDTYAAIVQHFSDGLRTCWQSEGVEKMHDVIQRLKKSYQGPGAKDYYLPVVRHALTGEKTGPSLADVVDVLGRDEVLRRLESAPARFDSQRSIDRDVL